MDEPATTVAAANSLTCLTVLPEVHIEMILKLFLARRTVREASAALLALGWQTVIENLGDGCTLAERQWSECIPSEPVMIDIPCDVRRR